MPVILENVTYREKNARNPVHNKIFNIESLRINDGEFVGIVDTAESGGALLGKMICGLIRPDIGSITAANGSGKMPVSVYLASEAEKAVSEITVEKEVCALLRKIEKRLISKIEVILFIYASLLFHFNIFFLFPKIE